MCMCLYVYMYIYIYRDRERERPICDGVVGAQTPAYDHRLAAAHLDLPQFILSSTSK